MIFSFFHCFCLLLQPTEPSFFQNRERDRLELLSARNMSIPSLDTHVPITIRGLDRWEKEIENSEIWKWGLQEGGEAKEKRKGGEGSEEEGGEGGGEKRRKKVGFLAAWRGEKKGRKGEEKGDGEGEGGREVSGVVGAIVDYYICMQAKTVLLGNRSFSFSFHFRNKKLPESEAVFVF